MVIEYNLLSEYHNHHHHNESKSRYDAAKRENDPEKLDNRI